MKIREKTATSREAFKIKNTFLYSSIEIPGKPTEFKVTCNLKEKKPTKPRTEQQLVGEKQNPKQNSVRGKRKIAFSVKTLLWEGCKNSSLKLCIQGLFLTKTKKG